MKTLLFIFIVILSPDFVFGQNIEVLGAIKIIDGTEGMNKVLTSDSDGLASWQLPASPDTVTYYERVKICCHNWMTINLDVDTYSNGDPIPQITDNVGWDTLTTGAYCYYDNDSTTYAAIYGKLYNWYAVNDSRGLAPDGWHIPTNFEVTNSIECLDESVAGYLMRETGVSNWDSPNTNATNFSGFTGLPGGFRSPSFQFEGEAGLWWTANEDDDINAWTLALFNNSPNADNMSIPKNAGISVRCVKD